MEPLILEKGETLLKKMFQSDEDIEQLFRKVENESDLANYTIEVGNPWWLAPSPSLSRGSWSDPVPLYRACCSCGRLCLRDPGSRSTILRS